ncbi:hypothetical protein IC619_016395, partial [Hazenella sp. IB182353]|uniref:hypothetical protein n=1 Tax=Polycladospora coralii TaxID=2771432 RepID=UPI001BCDBBF1
MLTTQFTYDGLDRTTSKVEHVGTEQEQTTTFDYRATSGEMISESVDGKKTNSYVYTASGNLFSMVKETEQGADETSYYQYNGSHIEML